MRIYIATRRQENAQSVRHAIVSAGHVCTATWLDERGYASMPKDQLMREEIAIRDLMEIDGSDALILVSEPDGSFVPGGKHVEFGFALAVGLRVLVLGTPENVFHWHPNVERCANIEALLAAIKNA